MPPLYLSWIVAIGLCVQAGRRVFTGEPIPNPAGALFLAAVLAFLDGGLYQLMMAALAAGIAAAPHLLNLKPNHAMLAAAIGGLLTFPGAWFVAGCALAGLYWIDKEPRAMVAGVALGGLVGVAAEILLA